MKLALALGMTASGAFGAGGPVFFVDSVAGSDSNLGTSSAAPLQTLSALDITSGMTIRLKRGSFFREMLIGSGTTGVTVEAYGAGVLPTMDCTDIIIDTWTQPDAGGAANVWAVTLTHSSDLQGSFASIWEDGERLLFTPDRTECNSTPGSFCITGSAVGNYGTTTTTFEIHASDSGDPNSNGAVYEAPVRPFGIAASDGWTIRNLRARRNGHNNGSIVMGVGARAYSCVAEDGVKHNWYCGRDTELYDCVVYKADYPHPDRDGWTGFVTHDADGSGASGYYERCKAILPKETYDWRIANSGQGLTGFYAHTDGTEGNSWNEITYVDCVAQFCADGIVTADTDTTIITRPRVAGCLSSIRVARGVITDAWIYQDQEITPNRAIECGAGITEIDGLRLWSNVNDNTAHIYCSSTGNASVIVTRSTMVRTSPGVTGYQTFMRHEGTGLVSTGNVIYGNNTGFGEGAIQADAVDEADFNAYGNGTIDFIIGANSYDTPALYLAAVQPTLEANSVEVATNPVTDAPNGDFTLTALSGLDPEVFGCERFPTYETVPSIASLDAL